MELNQNPKPYSVTPKQCATYFGISTSRIYDMVNNGKLHRGRHYLKIGKSVVIVVDKFIEWMEEQDHGN